MVISFITTSLLGSAPPPSCRKTHPLMDPTKGMAAVAARIRERALALRSSRAELETARIEMARIESEASAEVSKNSSCRAVLLQSLQSRNATELDALRADDASSALEDEIRRLRAEATGILELVRARRMRWVPPFQVRRPRVMRSSKLSMSCSDKLWKAQSTISL